MMMIYLAEASAANGLSPEAVGILIGGIITALVGGGLLGKRAGKTEGKAEALQVGPQPFMIELKETFVTRREHDRLEAMVAVNATRVEGMFRETMNEVKTLNSQTNSALIRQGERLSEEIEKVAKAAYDGRQRLHNHVNCHGEKIAALSVNNDVATELARVSEVIVEAIKETNKPNS